MKFMQRAAASASSAGAPDADSQSKKRKHGHSPAHGRIDAQIDQALIQAALDDQEATRQAALEKHAGADTHWTLNNAWEHKATVNAARSRLKILYVGYVDIDSSGESDSKEDATSKGRTSTRKGEAMGSKARWQQRRRRCLANMLTASQHHEQKLGPTDESDSQASDDGDEAPCKRKRAYSGGGVDSPPSQTRSRSKSRSRQSSESTKAKEFRDKRKKREIRLDQITSISSGGGGGSPSGGRASKCYTCQQTGHKSSDCPNRSMGSSRRIR